MNPIVFSQLLQPYQEQIEAQIKAYINHLGNRTALRDACEYALLNGGKRFRPALVQIIAKALGHGADVSYSALGIEFFHTASLIADDLPCMDDDDERRNKPALHKVFEESVALLATYALIAEGYGCIARNAQLINQSTLPFAKQSDQLCTMALENVTYYTGIEGATGGQFLDIFPSKLSLEVLKEVIEKKTVSLFAISFVLGWIFGGGDLNQLPLVKKSAGHFGQAFQIADDLGDMEQDTLNGRFINLANFFGEEKAKKMFHEEMEEFKKTLTELGLKSEELQALREMLIYQVEH